MAKKPTVDDLFHAMNRISLLSHDALCAYSTAGTDSLARKALERGFDRVAGLMECAGFAVTTAGISEKSPMQSPQ